MKIETSIENIIGILFVIQYIGWSKYEIFWDMIMDKNKWTNSGST